MPTKIGHFEILSELAKSATGAVYKANDAKSSQTVALKVIELSAFGAEAAALKTSLLEEAEKTKILNNPNLTTVFGASEIDGQFCAAMEYIQGNSVATMLARKEGFSIWDLLDIGRQLCSGLDDAFSHQIFHYSLEPSKIMCGWDGTTRVLGYGVSSVGKFMPQVSATPSILYYMSPEQIRGDNVDARSNLFSLGGIFYEMVTDRKAFDGADSSALVQNIVDSMPPSPSQLNPKLHPQLSALILKALAKDPDARYQSGREMLADLEKCKESKPLAAKVASPAPAAAVPAPVKAAAQTKFTSAPAAAPALPTPVAKAPATAPNRPVFDAIKPALEKKFTPAPAPQVEATRPEAERSPLARKTGAGAGTTSQLQPSSQFITSCVKATIESAGRTAAAPMSSALLEPPDIEPLQSPQIAIDPMMAEAAPSQSAATSFSEMTELPPLKESYLPPPPPAPQVFDKPEVTTTIYEPGDETEKPKIQPREVAEKAMKEIKNVPPHLLIYSVAGAAVLILIIAVALVLHVNSLNNDGDTPRTAAESGSSSTPATNQAAEAQPAPSQTAPPPGEAQPSVTIEEAQPVPVRSVSAAHKNARKKPASTSAPLIIPGQMAIDSTPQGAQVQIDGKSDPSWITPFTLSGLDPGKHNITVTKAGYTGDSRAVDVASGSKSFVVSHLTQLVATLSVASTPPGANVYVDGKDVGKLTPAQVSVDKGQHVVLVRKSGYIDETTDAQFVLGQTVSFSPTLRSLGNVDDIKTVGKMKKLFGGGAVQGMGTIAIKTQPKGAQIAVNQHMLEKNSPVEFMLDPGNYIVDITLSGYAPIRKIVSVDKGGKAVVDEVLQRQ
ncbi:MAG: PEGA domain-containing protein [Candidatus Sulfotelmatobacter sp.]|jgi:hypothetical protein